MNTKTASANALVTRLIEQKRDGGAWTEDDIRYLVEAIATHTLPDYQLSALLMAIYFKDLNAQEIAAFSEEIILSGTVMDLRTIAFPKISLCTIGGIGNKTSLALTALVAACGVIVPTFVTPQEHFLLGPLETLQAIPKIKTELSVEACQKQLKQIGCCVSRQPESFVPVNTELAAMSRAIGTVHCRPILVSGILSKCIAVGSENIVIDIKCGNGSFIQDVNQAKHIASLLTKTVRSLQRRCVVLITDCNQPIGNNLGAGLELQELIELLQGGGDPMLQELVIRLGMEMVRLSGVSGSTLSAKQSITQRLKDGSALKKLKELVKTQGGDPTYLDHPNKFPKAKQTYKLTANKRGYVHTINMGVLAKGVEVLTHPNKQSTLDPSAGCTELQKLGQQVQSGDPLMIIHYNTPAQLDSAIEYFHKAYCIAPKRPAETNLFIERVA